MTRCLVYVRQSLSRDDEDEASSLSLDFQERACRELAKARDWQVIEPVIRDLDVKGHDPTRPGIAAIFDRIERERIDAVIVYALSRFARDYILQETLWRRMNAAGVQLVSVKEPHAEDDLMRGISGVFNQYERRRLGMYLSSAFRERARRGLPHGKTPFGFAKDESGRLVIDKDAREHVLAIVTHLEAGKSYWWIAREFNRLAVDGRRWEPNIVRNTVRTPAIAGGVRCADVLTWDAHPPIIDRQRWERLMTTLDGRRRIRSKQVTSWLEGFLFCGCGAPMHLVAVGDGGRFRCSASPNLEQFQRPRAYPPCTFSPRSIPMHTAERLAVATLVDDLHVLVDPEIAYRHAEREFGRLEGISEQPRRTLDRKLHKLEAERERLLVLYRRASLDVERWEASDVELARQIAVVTAERDALPSPPDLATLQREHLSLAGMRDALPRALAADPAQARVILQAIGATVQRTSDGVTIIWPERLRPLLGAIT